MELTTKYTTDGKKVVVIGNLNSQEKIVQEVFLVNGAEVPSGENFVVKSLHDHPAVSWKEAQLKKVNEDYDRIYEAKRKEIDQLQRKYSLQSDIVKAKLESLYKLEKSLSANSLDLLFDFISGRIEYLVFDSYSELDIKGFNDVVGYQKDYGGLDGIKLCSVFGRSDGNLHYEIYRYSDGSGGKTTVYPCRTMDEAIEKLSSLFAERLKKGLDEYMLKAAIKHNLNIPKDAMDAYNEKKANVLLENIEAANKNIERLTSELKKIQQ